MARFYAGPKYVMCLASMGAYREPVVRHIKSFLGSSLEIYSGSPAYDPAIALVPPDDFLFTTVRNHYVGRDILFQSLPWITLLRADVVLFDWNPRVPHVWILLVLRRFLHRKTLLWGHAWPRNGIRTSRAARLRQRMASIASGIVTYTHTQATEVRALHPKVAVFAAPNALQSATACVFESNPNRNSVVYVGRLAPEKKPLLLLEAFEQHAETFTDTVLEIVGDGPQSDEVRRRAAKSPVAHRIRLHGHNSDRAALAEIYSRAAVSVSSGYAGLSLTQSFGFGVPVLISENEPHAPEIEAAIDGWNSSFFSTDDAISLCVALGRVFNNEIHFAPGDQIAQDCAKRYSTESMSDGLLRALVAE